MFATLRQSTVLLVSAILLWQASQSCAITIDTVPVGNAGNSPDLETGFGAVSYNYRMGATEVTVGQYTAFLNAVAADDTWGLYTHVGVTANIPDIARSGNSGSYTYTVIGSPNRPVTYVDWGDAARFVNWLHNGQPTGPQDSSTTEDGAYSLNGANHSAALNVVARNAGATWFLPSENEWYKAAYHQNDGPTGNYWDYPTTSDTAPLAVLPPGGANSANYDHVVPTSFFGPGMTDVGSYLTSPSPYGTFDQGGNLMEWTEGIESLQSSGTFMRGMRGGAWSTSFEVLQASFEVFVNDPQLAGIDVGFRVATIPEPTTLSLAMLASLAGLGLWNRRRLRRAFK